MGWKVVTVYISHIGFMSLLLTVLKVSVHNRASAVFSPLSFHGRHTQLCLVCSVAVPNRCQISLSSGGTFSTLPISSRAPATSCWLGLYVPSAWRFFRAVRARQTIPTAASRTARHASGTATISHGTRSCCGCFWRPHEEQNIRKCILTSLITFKKNTTFHFDISFF